MTSGYLLTDYLLWRMSELPRYITANNYPAFKAAYEKAVKEEKGIFVFEEQEVLTNYAKYLVEYVELKLFEDD